MKISLPILILAVTMASCGTDPRDPFRESAAAIGRESSNRERQQANREEMFSRLQQKKKEDEVANNARRVLESRQRNPNLPDDLRHPSFRNPNFRN